MFNWFKTNKETIKTILLTATLAAGIAFYFGIKYEQTKMDTIEAKVQVEIEQLKASLPSETTDQKNSK